MQVCQTIRVTGYGLRDSWRRSAPPNPRLSTGPGLATETCICPPVEWKKPAGGGLFSFSLYTFSMADFDRFRARFPQIFWAGKSFCISDCYFRQSGRGLDKISTGRPKTSYSESRSSEGPAPGQATGYRPQLSYRLQAPPSSFPAPGCIIIPADRLDGRCRKAEESPDSAGQCAG